MTDPDDDRPDDAVDDEDLAEMADELSDVLRELRDELAATREARESQPVEQQPATGTASGRGGGVPDIPIDLPSATDVLAFTDEKLIPATITVLEVNIRALELLQKGIRWARPDKAGENAERMRSHAESVSRSTLQRLDTVLANLQDAAGRGALPEDAEASDVITEARRLRDEIDVALEERAESREEGDVSEATEEDDDEARSDPFGLDDQPEVDVDVESELESIKAELGKDEDVDGDADHAEGDEAEPDAEDPADDGTDEQGAVGVTDDTGDATDGEDGPADAGPSGVFGDDGVGDTDVGDDGADGDGHDDHGDQDADDAADHGNHDGAGAADDTDPSDSP
jgi:hypothetical protein